MRFAITRNVLQCDRNLIRTDEGYSWVDQIPSGMMTYDTDFLPRDCVRTSLHLVGKSLEERENIERYTKALGSIPIDERPPLCSFIPKEEYKVFITNLVKRLEAHLSEPSYYDLCYSRHTAVFDSLQRALVHLDKISHHSAESDANRPVLASFYPDTDNKCRQVKYDRVSGRTGRLKVASGPSILTLKKEYRDILRSRFDNGKIISVDYKSLEARAFLYLSGGTEPSEDIYAAAASKLFNDEYPRHIVKACVISLLYGMGDTALAIKLNLDKGKVRKLSRAVRKHFRYDELKTKLEARLRDDTISNYYGRVVSVPDERLLLNTYVQSTAVDIVLHGFLNIIKAVPATQAVPLFVLHDALIMDASEDFDTESVKVAEKIDGFDGHFPVHVSSF